MSKRAPVPVPSSSSNQKQSVVEKLSMLRSFVGENGSFSETDLSHCLRQSGYMVELAAEKLMTGQYQPAKKQRPSPSFLPKKPTQSISSIKPQQRSSPPLQKMTTSTASSTTPKRSQGTTTTTTSRQPQHPNSIKKKKNAAASASKGIAKPALVTPKTPKQQPNSDNTIAQGDWLLCQRWVSDGICTQRHGSCDYQEVLEVEVCDSGLLRIRGRRIHGQFPKALCRVLSPLLRKDKNANPILRLEATALMEERHLPMGAQVAFSLRYVRTPRAVWKQGRMNGRINQI